MIVWQWEENRAEFWCQKVIVAKPAAACTPVDGDEKEEEEGEEGLVYICQQIVFFLFIKLVIWTAS